MDTDMAMPDLPELPATHEELAKHIHDNPDKTVEQILEPYRRFESQLRTVYAQDRKNPILEDPHLNVLPLFNENTQYVKTRARDLASESEEEKSRYIMALPDDKRRANGSPATVGSLAEFQKNFNIFSESSMVDMNWDNVVAAGSSVVNCLLPVPAEFNTTKRKLREYYHEKFCPASDVDLFLYGLTHDEAIDKIQKIERAVREALLNEVTVVRTKYAITIASQYPVRHVQIVLRVYKSVSEILTGFDIDAAGGAYDGKQVYVTPRALGSFITQVNHIDLSRRSPSYENRLSKYSHRNFEIYWPELDRSRVDPTIFERSFKRTLGLARLLVLERLPTNTARENYLNKRRQERGRPVVQRHNHTQLWGNIKDAHEDEVADWLSEEEVSNYHTFTIPYGEKFHAKRIEKLCYTRDLLLNAEWNQPKEREVYLHRHPAFFGRVQDVIEDCCGTCPVPQTEEEKEVAAKEGEIYISGKVEFLIDDPGRQQIGSFNPLTEQDWTDMAYVGNTARLCQSIVNGDIDDILNWLSQEDSDPNTRDYTGRTPLHLAVMTSTHEVVECLVEHGARLTARLADGRTALHLAAARGDIDMIRTLMEKSIANEEAEEERKDKRREAARSEAAKKEGDAEDLASDKDSEDDEMTDWEQSETDAFSATTSSFVKIKEGEESEEDDGAVPNESEDEPDFYQIDVLAWDVPCSPLHLAIVGGHEEAVEVLCDYGADSILPVKFLNSDRDETAALLTLTLALSLDANKAKSMAKLLLKLGAVSSQASKDGKTAFMRYVESDSLAMVDVLLEQDKPGIKAAINHLAAQSTWNGYLLSPLHVALENENLVLVLRLLEAGANPQIDYETWLKSAKVSTIAYRLDSLERNKEIFRETQQPIIAAIYHGRADAVLALLEKGADPSSLTISTQQLLENKYMRRYGKGVSAVDLVDDLLQRLRDYKQVDDKPVKPQKPPGLENYLDNFEPGTYRHWVVSRHVTAAQKRYASMYESYEERVKALNSKEVKAKEAKHEYLLELVSDLERIKKALISHGGKTFSELYPDIIAPEEVPPNYSNTPYRQSSIEAKPEPFKHKFGFLYDRDITDKKHEGYIELFEAAWAGNLDRLKELTLQAWGEDYSQPPLKVVVEDNEYNSPFSVAFLRGHHEMAKVILDIVKAQFTPPEKENVRYRLRTGGSEDGDSECDSDSDDGADPDVVTEKVDHAFTIDNIGQVSMEVQSNTQPLHVVTGFSNTFSMDGEYGHIKGSGTLFSHCLEEDDSAGLKLLLDLAQYWGKHFVEDPNNDDVEDTGKGFIFPQHDFEHAIRSGKTRLLGQIIKKTGGGIPLDHLVKKSGVALQSKPRYYQGLTVYGKKRRDWATAGRNMVTRTSGTKTPPLLQAAWSLNMDSIEFFLSETPYRLYSEFGNSKAARDDPRLRHLIDRPGGFDRAIASWLGADNDLVIHVVVRSNPGKRANEALEYLIDNCPSALEKRSPDGDTPLHVACRLGRRQFIRKLIASNADQSVRNSQGENLLHQILGSASSAHRLETVLGELDQELLGSFFLQRKDLIHFGYTPVHQWIKTTMYHGGPHERRRFLKTLLTYSERYSQGEVLDKLSSAGDTCLHSAIMDADIVCAKVLIDHDPSLLYRENAVGRTPAEVAYEALTAKQLSLPTSTRDYSRREFDCVRTACDQQPEFYLRDTKSEDTQTLAPEAAAEEVGLSGSYSVHDLNLIKAHLGLAEAENSDYGPIDDFKNRLHHHVVWDLCRTAMSKHPHPRRLVSLNEANDVVKRLGEQEVRSRYFSINARHDEYEDAEERPEDQAQTILNRHNPVAWWAVSGDHGDAVKGEFDKCETCGQYHE